MKPIIIASRCGYRFYRLCRLGTHGIPAASKSQGFQPAGFLVPFRACGLAKNYGIGIRAGFLAFRLFGFLALIVRINLNRSRGIGTLIPARSIVAPG